MSVILTDEMLEITSYSQRAKAAREARSRYRVDAAELHVCTCGDVHYRRKEEDKEVKKESK